MGKTKYYKCPVGNGCEYYKDQHGTHHMKYHTEEELKIGRLNCLNELSMYKKLFSKSKLIN